MNIKLNVLNRAIKEAKSSTVCRGKVGAVLFTRNGNILASTHNSCFYGHSEKGKFTIHAEEMLMYKFAKIKGAGRFKKDGKLNVLVVRYVPQTDTLGVAKPCNKCTYLLGKVNVNVFYTDYDGCVKKL